MTANRRIFLNIIATYGRSLYALVCGVFISRWMSAAGKSEFGVCGVVGGMMAIELLAYTMRQDCGGKLLWQFTVAIKCDPVAPPRNDHLDDSRNCCRSIPRFRILPQTCRKYDTLYTI